MQLPIWEEESESFVLLYNQDTGPKRKRKIFFMLLGTVDITIVNIVCSSCHVPTRLLFFSLKSSNRGGERMFSTLPPPGEWNRRFAPNRKRKMGK